MSFQLVAGPYSIDISTLWHAVHLCDSYTYEGHDMRLPNSTGQGCVLRKNLWLTTKLLTDN